MFPIQDLENPEDSLSIPNLNSNFDADPERWQDFLLSSSMNDGNSNNASSSQNNRSDRGRTRSHSHSINPQGSNIPPFQRANVQDAVLLAQFAAGAGSLPQSTHDSNYNALLALLQAQNTPHSSSFPMGMNLYGQPSMPNANQIPSIPPHLQWPSTFNQQQRQRFPSYNSPGMPVHSSGYSNLPPINTNVHSSTPGPSSATPAPSNASATPSDAGDPTVTEDKRRRNTAASARFRIKKKQRNLNLERTVSDLSGRADELEKEAADLRRENGWLKEIVMLKGSRLAGLDVSPQSLPKPPDGDASSFWGPDIASSSRLPDEGRRHSEKSDSESDDSDTETESSARKPETSKGKEKRK